MQLGMVGLGRMGANIVRRLLRYGHTAVAFDRDRKAVDAVVSEGASAAIDLADLVRQLAKPRAVWVMLPAGEATQTAIDTLAGLLEAGDIIIDGGNTFWQDDIRRAAALKQRGLNYVDVGTSGGVWGLERGYCMMIGGDEKVVAGLDPIFRALAPGLGTIPRTGGDGAPPAPGELGYHRVGPNGAGHFVKMIHNGIEYGMMQAFAEGFDILRNAASKGLPAEHRLDLDVAAIAETWRRGSVVTSWLLDLTAAALAQDAKLDAYSGHVEDSGEGRWTLMAAIDEAVPAHVLSAALYARFRSRQEASFADKMLSAMRKGFGGHVEAPRPSQKS